MLSHAHRKRGRQARQIARFVGAILCIFLSHLGEGREYIVNQQDAQCSDRNPGTASKPFKTISAAVVKVRAGDTIIVHGGNYREAVIILASGTAQAPITIEAAPGETPVIKGSEIIKGWESGDGRIWNARLKHFPPRNASPKNSTFYNTNDVRQVFTRDGALLDAHRLRRVTKREAMKEDTFFCDTEHSILYVWLPASASPVERPPEVSVRAGWLHIEANHIVVRGIQMRHSSTTSISNAPAATVAGHDNTIENCVISWADFVGISTGGHDNVFRNCLIACNGDCGIGATGEHHLIEGCRVVYNNVDRYSPEWHAGGAKLVPYFSHGLIRHNEFAYNLGSGLWLDIGCNDNVIDGNLAHGNEGPGITIEISKNNLILNNICYENLNNLSGPFRDAKGMVFETSVDERRLWPSPLSTIYHSGGGRGIYISTSPGTKILHNTIYSNQGEGICIEGGSRALGSETLETRDDTIANNIIVFNKVSQLTIRSETESKKTIQSDHNLLFTVGTILARNGWAGLPAFSMTDWQKMSGLDTHSIDADPRFALAPMQDFRVLKNSAAIDAGVAVPEADHDFFGHSRGKDKTTIGACEEPAENYPQPVWQSLSQTIRSGHQ